VMRVVSFHQELGLGHQGKVRKCHWSQKDPCLHGGHWWAMEPIIWSVQAIMMSGSSHVAQWQTDWWGPGDGKRCPHHRLFNEGRLW